MRKEFPDGIRTKCELCGTVVRVVGTTTLHYEPIGPDAAKLERLRECRENATKLGLFFGETDDSDFAWALNELEKAWGVK